MATRKKKAAAVEAPASEVVTPEIIIETPIVEEVASEDAAQLSIEETVIEAVVVETAEADFEDDDEDEDDSGDADDLDEDDLDEDEDDSDDEDDSEDSDDEDDDDDEDEEDADDDEVEDDDDEDSDDEDDDSGDVKVANKLHAPRPPIKLERLQKILAAAGIASRRHAEELIEQGRVQVNGKIVSTLGTKADAGRDHIRVDGKLLHGKERLRYYMLNKPKGFVTTVKDPEGRPTVMQFFEKMKERLYPVGRLDYLSEGLLLVTNDGDLANRLTKAASGVEKTYLVKVAGQPTEDELDKLRAGVLIPRGKMGEGRVKTAPARIRQVRQGDNPWFEVVIIEGRNRELRKMFEEVGHFVEKIRRIGYGPLVLDMEPGLMRELDEEELTQLRLAAEGKLKKAKDARKILEKQLPTVKAMASPKRFDPFREEPTDGEQPREERPYGERTAGRGGDFRVQRGSSNFQSNDQRGPQGGGDDRGFRPREGAGYRPNQTDSRDRRPGTFGNSKFGNTGNTGSTRTGGNRPGAARPYDRAAGRPSARPAWQRPGQEERPAEFNVAQDFGNDRNPPAAGKSFGNRPAGKSGFGAKPFGDRPRSFEDRKPYGDRPAKPFGDRPQAAQEFGERPAKPFGERPARPFGDRPQGGKPFGDRPARSFGDRPQKPFGDKPERKSWSKPGGDDRSGGFKRPTPFQRADDDFSDLEPRKPVKIFIEPVGSDDRSNSPRPSRPSTSRPYSAGSSAPRPGGDRPYAARPASSRPSSDRPSRPQSDRPSYDRPRPERSERPSYDRPSAPRSDRPNTDRPRFDRGGSGGAPRPGGNRPGAPRSNFDRPQSDRPSFNKPRYDRPERSDRPSSDRPSYGRPGTGRPSGDGPKAPREGGLERRFTTSSGVPRAGGARPSSKHPKPGAGKPSNRGGAQSRGKSGGFPGGSKGKPGGKRPGGAPGGRKRS
jgi:23S rRNA pseudouridine2605 synthase